MSFYVLSKGNLSQIELDYLTHSGGSRLEPTLSPHQKPKPNKDAFIKSYAIEVMSKPLITVPTEAMADEVLKIFKDKKINHVLLTEGKQLKGLVSAKDLAFLTSLEIEAHAKASQFMSQLILACDEDTPLDHLARVMVTEHISALPVVGKDKSVVGIVTHHDLLRWIFSQEKEV